MDFDYIKNGHRFIAVRLSQQKEIDADLKATQQIEFIGRLIDDGAQSMFVLMILEEIKDTRSKLSQSSVTVF